MSGPRNWVLLLAACAVTFAATSIYLWRELAEERAHPPAVAATLPAPTRIVSPPANVFSPTGKGKVARPPGTASSALPPDPDVDPTEYQRQQSRQLLEQLANPAARARLLAQARVGVRNAYPWIAERLKLGPEEYDKLIETLALKNLAASEAFARCTADPACDPSEQGPALDVAQHQAIAEVLGPERMALFETYQQTMNERETVLNLRGRLPDQAFLSTEQSESLITALANESWQMQQDAQLAGQSLAGYGMSGGWIYYADQGTTEQQIRSAETYVDRMIARAALVLNPEQLRYFTQMQQDLLANLRGQLEQVESEKQAR